MVTALVVATHPDDETVWCGGTILMHKGWEWTVISLCRRDDKDREPKFRKACKKLGVRCAISDLEDENIEQPLASLDEVKQRIRAMLKQAKAGSIFDVLFTHGSNGEYNHQRHKEVHRAVREMIASGELRSKKLFFFNYELANRGFYCVPNTRGSSVNTRLNSKIARAKHLLITSVYQFSNGSFEERSASAVESFKVEQSCDR